MPEPVAARTDLVKDFTSLLDKLPEELLRATVAHTLSYVYELYDMTQPDAGHKA